MNCVPLDGMAAASTLGRVSAAAARAGAGGLAEGPAGAAVGAGALATVVVGAGAGDAAAGAGAAGAAAAVRTGNPPEHCGPPPCSSQASVLPPGTMVWPERLCPISWAMMLTGAQLLDLVA